MGLTTALIVGEIIIGLGVMASILLQTGYTAGMSGAFGGGMAQQGSYGGKKQGVDEFLARVTIVLAIVFAVLTLLLARLW